MLSKILKKSTCASCKFCCVFRKKSLWEVPNFPLEKIDELAKFAVTPPVFTEGEALTLHLEGLYKTTCEEETAPCNFLDSQKGCKLTDDLKPLQCKIWPFRIVKRHSKNFLIFETTCPALGDTLTEELREFAKTLMPDLKKYIEARPYVALDDKEGKTKSFPVVCCLDDSEEK